MRRHGKSPQVILLVMTIFEIYDLYTLSNHAIIIAEMEDNSFERIMDCLYYIVEDQTLSAWEAYEAK